MRIKEIWYYYTLLCIVILNSIIASPVIVQQQKKAVEAVEASSAESDKPARLDDDIFGKNTHHGGEKDKRLIKLKALKLGAGAIKAGAIGIGLKAATKIGKIGVKTAASLGIKALIINLLFGQINKIIDFKTRLLTQLDQQNRIKNAQYLGIGLPEQKPIPATNPVNQSPYVYQASSTPGEPEDVQVTPGSRGSGGGSSTQHHNETLPQFDRNKVSLAVPNTLVGPAFNVVNGASQIIGSVLQNIAARLAKFLEAVKPLYRHKLGYKSRKRETEDEFSSDDLGLDSSEKNEEVVKLGDTTAVQNKQTNSNVKSSYTALSSS